jgi:hypothetical protein
MTARFVMKNKPGTDENNKYSKASPICAAKETVSIPKYISRVCFDSK